MVHTIGIMGAPKKPDIQEKDRHSFKHFKLLRPVPAKLHDNGCGRDRAGNRKLHFDQYTALILLYFFKPILSSLRGIQQASELKKVQRIPGCPRAALGSLSEAASVLDADLLRAIIGAWVNQRVPSRQTTEFKDLAGIITVVDGSLLPALPKITEAMWRDDQHRAFKMHTHFELLKGVPVRLDLTDAGEAGSFPLRGRQRTRGAASGSATGPRLRHGPRLRPIRTLSTNH